MVVLLGDGRGGFRRAEGSPLKVAPSVRKVALGDVNGDARLDIAAAEHDSYAVTLLLGDGRGGATATVRERTRCPGRPANSRRPATAS